jgi:hypothetical protein
VVEAGDPQSAISWLTKLYGTLGGFKLGPLSAKFA